MLNPQKLRILTFPQHIAGNQLQLNALVIPTQLLLNHLIPFEKQLPPGTLVDLPKFITADLKLRLKAIQGLSSYPYGDENALNDEGAKSQAFDTTIRFPDNLPLLYEALESQFVIDK